MAGQFRPLATGADGTVGREDADLLAQTTMSLEIEDGLRDALSRAKRQGAPPRWLLAALAGLVVLLALACACLALAVGYLAAAQRPLGSAAAASSLAANASAGFPIQVDLSRQLCSNNGIRYGRQPCSCFACFTGARCETAVPLDECTINANSGTPLLFEEWWVAHPAAETRIRASDRIGYQASQLPRLEAAIRAVHAMVGNAVTEGRRIVIGPGSSELISQALFAYAKLNASAGPLAVTAQAPWYGAYRMQATLPASRLFAWSDSPDASAQPVLEMVTSPNNPDGSLRERTVPGAMALHDFAYYWPHFTPVTGPAQLNGTDIAVFTLSKLSGHAGTRIGWAIVSDLALADALAVNARFSLSVDSQLRAATILESLLGSQGKVLNWAGERMVGRWQRLHSIFNASSRFAAQPLPPPAMDAWSSTVRAHSPAYLWLRCTNAQRDPDCAAALKAAGILGREGPAFGAGPEHVRLELLMREEEFELMAQKLAAAA